MATTPPTAVAIDLDRFQRGALYAGIAALVVCLIGAPFSPQQFFRSYLVAYQLWLGVALGCMAILMLYHLTGGAWGFVIRRPLEAGMRTLPLLLLLIVPVWVGMKYLYLWTDPAVVAGDKALESKQVYLNVPFFVGRTLLYFAIWLSMAYVLHRWSRRQDETGDLHLPRRFRLLSGPGLVLYGLTITFASVDWVMSLQPHWYSTIFPPLFAVGQILTGFAFVILFLFLLAPRAQFRAALAPDTLNDLGNLLLTFVIFWAYMTFSQFLLVWVGNLKEEIVWYLPRSRDGWQYVIWLLFVFHFAVPFLLLLQRSIKKDIGSLAGVAALLLFMHLVHLDWEVLPVFKNTPLYQHWMDFLAPVGVGGIWLAFFLWQLKRMPLLPLHDPNGLEAARLHELDLGEALSHG